MKKIFYLLILSLSLAACCNCDPLDQTSKPCMDVQTIEVYVGASDWQYTNFQGSAYENNYFYAVVDVPEITRSVFDRGEVQAYVVYNPGTQDAFKHILPYVRHYEEQVEGGWNYYTETVDCLYGPGWVEFNYSASDFAYEDDANINPNGMYFTIVITKEI